jgi:hypothetical protein
MSEERRNGLKLGAWHMMGLCGTGWLVQIGWPNGFGLVSGWILCFSAIVLGIWLMGRKDNRNERGLIVMVMILASLWLIFTGLQPLWIRLLYPH